MKKLSLLLTTAFIFLSGSLAQAQTKYEIDAAHSTLGFAVKHMGVSTTRGAFSDFKGTIDYDPANPAAFAADVTVDAKSIDTANENRDNHLRGEDFFDVEKYPSITFQNAKLEQKDGKSVIVGDLTIKDVTKSVEIPVEISGPVKGMGGGDVIGLAGETTINRQDFHVKWNKAWDAGGLVVADDVKLIVEVEAKVSEATQ